MGTGAPAKTFRDYIAEFETQQRDTPQTYPVAPLSAAPGDTPFVRVRGLSAFWRADDEPGLLPRLEDLLAALYGLGWPCHYLITGQQGHVQAFYGLEAPHGDALLAELLSAVLPGIHLDDAPAAPLTDLLQRRGLADCRGLLTGIPTRRAATLAPSERAAGPARPPATDADAIERVVRGMGDDAWAYWVRAVPMPPGHVAIEASNLLTHLTALSTQLKRQMQEVSMYTKQVGNESTGTTRTLSDEIVNAEAEYAQSLVERQRDRYRQAKAVGLWHVEAHALTTTDWARARLLALLRAAFGGPDSIPEPIRTHHARAGHSPAPAGAGPTTTALTSIELATLTQLPRREADGFRIAPFARFDVDPLPAPAGPTVTLGRILDGERLGPPLALPVNDLPKHVLVAGMTGSGKTTTVFHLLQQLSAIGKPFLVIEPAKAEYRDLLSPTTGGAAGLIPNLRVYTLADENVAPFRLNPFEFEVMGAQQRVHVQSHIDFLKAVFNAAFILYAPMPYVLEMCLHEVYTDCGWDLSTGRNSRLSEKDHEKAGQLGIFPTLSDLYAKIDEVVDRLGYEARIEMDVKAGLRARIGSLMLGNKGLMLNCRHGIPTIELLKHPTVLELERIGNDDEKAFIIGLVLTRLYEFRRLQAAAGKRVPFRHLLIIEEAHRLLKNVSTEQAVEGANTRGQAVETFANMLSEVRGYGQAILIAEQIPTKLAPDALKNTNLKLVHRLVAADEREAVAGAMNMDEAQSALLSTLRGGRFAAFAEPADHPYLVSVDNVRAAISGPMSDDKVRTAMSQHTAAPQFEPAPGYRRHTQDGQAQLNPPMLALAQQALLDPAFAEEWAALLLHVLHAPSAAPRHQIGDLARRLQAIGGPSDPAAADEALRTVIVLAAAQSLARRGRLYRWPCRVEEELRAGLLDGLMGLLRGDGTTDAALSAFAAAYGAATARAVGPFAGCVACAQRCLWRADVAVAAAAAGLRDEAAAIMAGGGGNRPAQEKIAALSYSALGHVAGPLPDAPGAAPFVCLAAHLLAQPTIRRAAQVETAETVRRLLSAPAAP